MRLVYMCTGVCVLAIIFIPFSDVTNCFRVMTNATEEKAVLRREMDEDVAELRQDYELTNEQRVAVYEAELAEWKSYEEALVSKYCSITESFDARWIQGKKAVP